MMLDSDTMLAESMLSGATFAAMGRLGGPEAIAVLTRAADRVIREADAGAPDWQARSAASAIAQALANMRDPATQAAYDRLETRFGRLYVIPVVPPEPYRAPPHAHRTVPRWSFELEAVDEPIVEPVSKFGGQPVWIGDPTWPLSVDGAPATFLAQFTIPGRDGLAYVFLDDAFIQTAADIHWGVVIVHPGPVSVPCVATPTGPTFWTDSTETPEPKRYLSRRIPRQVESRIVLEAGLDFDDWDVLNLDPETSRDDDRDWNKIGGNPRWLQGDETPDEPGWHFLFQFTAGKVGHELADGAEVYGLIHDDGRGRLIVHSH
jgi:hypothetical protein